MMHSLPTPDDIFLLEVGNPHHDRLGRFTYASERSQSSLHDSYRSGMKGSQPFHQGITDIDEITFGDGTSGLRRRYKPWARMDANRLALNDWLTYKTDQLFGFGIVPEMHFDSSKTTVQRLIPNCQTPQQLGLRGWHDPRINRENRMITTSVLRGPRSRSAGLLDFVTGQKDRHEGNWLIENPFERNRRLWLIDHSLSFPDMNVVTPHNLSPFTNSWEDEQYTEAPELLDRWNREIVPLAKHHEFPQDSVESALARLIYLCDGGTIRNFHHQILRQSAARLGRPPPNISPRIG